MIIFRADKSTYDLHVWYGDLLIPFHLESQRPHLERPNIIQEPVCVEVALRRAKARCMFQELVPLIQVQASDSLAARKPEREVTRSAWQLVERARRGGKVCGIE